LSLVPDYAQSHVWLGYVLIFTGRAAQGIAECEHALKLDRNHASTHATIGLGKVFIGCAEETEAHILEAQHLSPRDTWNYAWMAITGLANLHLGRYQQAVEALRLSVEANRNYPVPNFLLAAALSQLGRQEEARSAVRAGLALNPTFAISRVRAAWATSSDNPTHMVGLERVIEGLRKAGAPEG